MHLSTTRCLVALLLSASAASAQNVHVVDVAGGPGSDFTSIFNAVSAAQSGDVLLVREGDYFEPVKILGKSLVIAVEPGADVSVDTVVVQNLAADDMVSVRGLRVRGGGAGQIPALQVKNCLGAVWIEDVPVEGAPQAFVAGGVYCVDSANVVFQRCTFEAPFQLAQPTFVSERSTAFLLETTVIGEDGQTSFFPTSSTTSPGRNAIVVDDGELYLYASYAEGGRGGGSLNTGAMFAGRKGGNGIALIGTDPIVRVFDSVLVGGAGGFGTGGAPNGPSGLEFSIIAPLGAVDEEPGIATSMTVDSPTRETGQIEASFFGQPGDRVWLKYSLEPSDARFSGRWNGPNFLRQGVQLSFLGTVPANGVLTISAPAGELGLGVEAVTLYAQGVFLGSRFTFSSPATLTLLDSAF